MLKQILVVAATCHCFIFPCSLSYLSPLLLIALLLLNFGRVLLSTELSVAIPLDQHLVFFELDDLKLFALAIFLSMAASVLVSNGQSQLSEK